MPDFVWHAVDANGKAVEGRLAAASASAAMKQLQGRGLTPLQIEDASAAGAWRTPGAAGASGATGASGAPGAAPAPAFMQRRQRQDRGPVRPADVLAFTSELAIMLRAGLALDNALRVLIDMSHKPSVAALLQGLLDQVKGGTPMSRALAQQHALFGDFYINMVRSGEASGQLSAVLTRLVEHLERLRALRESVVSACIYPVFLLAVALLSLAAMLGFVVPKFETIFTDMGDALPLLTRWVLDLSHGFVEYGLVLGLLLGAGGVLLARWLRSPGGRAQGQALLLRLPLVGRLLLKYELTLFSRALGTLLGNGVPMLTALHIATESVGVTVLRQALLPVGPFVKGGGKMVNAISATQIFEPMAINLIRVGEETGRIGPMMLELAHILNREVEVGIKRALALIEPLLILVLGLLIAIIIVSVLLGILSINDFAV